MVKKVISIATAFLMLFCMIPFAAFAETVVCPKCGESTLTTNQDISVSVGEQIGLPLSLKRAYCSNCHYAKYEYNILGIAGEQAYDDGDELHIINFLKNLKAELLGQNATAEKAPSGIGRKDLPGYANDKGAALIDKDGWPTATYTMLLDGYDTSVGVDTVYKHSKFNNGSWFNQVDGSYSVKGDSVTVYSIYNDANSLHSLIGSISYYYKAPVSGYYTLNSFDISGSYSIRDSGGSYYYGSYGEYSLQFQYYFGDTVHSPTLDFKNVVSNQTPFHVTRDSLTKYFTKGQLIYFSFSVYPPYSVSKDYPYKSITIQSTAPTLTVQDLTSNQITNNNNITINKNTWNGNIYVDNSTNLTYIYPQYTTINENNETVTNISNNPIIYNNETKQYYTYDTVTNNYYYITYEQQPATPTPSPSPSPSPAPKETPAPSESPTLTPAPGTTPTPTPKPGGSISTPETGKPGGSSGSSGSSWWDKLLDKLGSALIDGLLGAISAVLKLIFKLLSTILGWIIWLVSQVLTLFPFLPPGLGALLIGGVVVCFVIGIIKFIRG